MSTQHTDWRKPHVFQPDGNPDGNCACGLPEDIPSMHIQTEKQHTDWKENWKTLVLDIGMKALPYVKRYPLGQLEKRGIEFIEKLIFHAVAEQTEQFIKRLKAINSEMVSKDIQVHKSLIQFYINELESSLTSPTTKKGGA